MNEELLKELYDDMLDECYPIIKIGSLEYLPSVGLYIVFFTRTSVLTQ